MSVPFLILKVLLLSEQRPYHWHDRFPEGGEGKHLIVSLLDDEISDSDGSTVTVGDKVRSNSPTPDQLSDLEGVKELIRNCVYDCLNIDERWVIVNCHEPVSVLFGFQPMRQHISASPSPRFR